MKKLKKKYLNGFKRSFNADEVKITRHLALIMVVGEGMRRSVGTTARAAKALAEARLILI